MHYNNTLQLERQIQMQNQMRERQAAMMIARSRDMFTWFGSFYTLVLVGGLAGWVKQAFYSFL